MKTAMYIVLASPAGLFTLRAQRPTAANKRRATGKYTLQI
jgi:hypothetical protein